MNSPNQVQLPSRSFVRLFYVAFLAMLVLIVGAVYTILRYGVRTGTVLDFDDPQFHPSEGSILIGKSIGSIRYELASRQAKTVGDITYETNSDGLRDTEHAKQKPDGVYRIIFVGDSHTFGLGLPLQDTASSRLQELMKDRAAQYGTVETINIAVPGNHMTANIERLNEKGLVYNPDLLVLLYCLDDIHFSGVVPAVQGPYNFSTAREYYRFVEDIQHYISGRPISADREEFERFLADSGQEEAVAKLKSIPAVRQSTYEELYSLPMFRDRLAQGLDELAAISRERNLPVVIGLIPFLTDQSFGEYPLTSLHRMLIEEFQSRGFTAIDLLDVLRPFSAFRVHLPDDTHLNTLANQLIALSLERVITENKLIVRR